MHGGGGRENLCMEAEEERKYSTTTTTTAAAAAAAINLLITSVDCDPTAELPLSDRHAPLRWDAIFDALNLANYCLATRRLAHPPPTGVAFLVLLALKKAAFLHISDESERENHRYRISYDERFMNELPSFHDLRALPRFHRFTALPEDLQLNVIGRLDGVGFARLRCVSRRLSRLRWSHEFNICMYTNPPQLKMAASSYSYSSILRFPTAIFMAAAAVLFVFSEI